MPRPPILLVLCAVLALWVWVERRDAESVRKQLGEAVAEIGRQEEANRELKDAVDAQNLAIQQAKARVSKAAIEAGSRASDELKALPQKLKEDRSVGPTPAEMNQWLDSLFLP